MVDILLYKDFLNKVAVHVTYYRGTGPYLPEYKTEIKVCGSLQRTENIFSYCEFTSLHLSNFLSPTDASCVIHMLP
jgi:hypothetical protein